MPSMSTCFEPFRFFVLETSPTPPRDVCSTTPLAVVHHNLLPRWSAPQSRQSTTGTFPGSITSTRIVLSLSLPCVCSLTMTRTSASVSSTYYVISITYRIVSQAHTILPATITICIAHYLAVGQDQLYRTLSSPHTVSPSAKTSRTTHYLYPTLSLPRFTTHTHAPALIFLCLSTLVTLVSATLWRVTLWMAVTLNLAAPPPFDASFHTLFHLLSAKV